jgi:NadR type nicotinamide-nucleotide adenylyltransferase
VGVARIDAANRSRLTVAVVGAECSGKTTLASGLAQRFAAPWVPEYAREYLAQRTGYDAADVLAIARGQQRAEDATTSHNDLVFADTDLVVIKVWWNVRYGGADEWIDSTLSALISGDRARAYLLPTPDIPWTPDPLREHPNDRPALHARYKKLLDDLGVQYLEVSGSEDQRLDAASAAVRRWLSG